MFCINLDTTDPFFNLAIEELLLKNSKEEYLILYINDPAVIIGKHQSGHREVNTKFVTENKIPVIRRISGGGTVFHDHGNLNFSFIRQSESGKQIDFRKYTRPVIDFLKSVGVQASFEGKNDLKVSGLKISGNAEHVYRNRVLHHGTLLFSTSLEMLRNSIRRDTSCYISRAVISNPSSVINLNGILSRFQNIHELRSEMINYFLKNFSDLVLYKPVPEELLQAEYLSSSKYKTWEWNWAYGPEYIFQNKFEISETLHSCNLFIKDGIIRKCSISGSDQMKSTSEKIPGCRHMVNDLSEFFKSENISITAMEIYNFF
jgi:lipoyltransferase and lipoate-protein ligase